MFLALVQFINVLKPFTSEFIRVSIVENEVILVYVPTDEPLLVLRGEVWRNRLVVGFWRLLLDLSVGGRSLLILMLSQEFSAGHRAEVDTGVGCLSGLLVGASNSVAQRRGSLLVSACLSLGCTLHNLH